MRGYQKNNVFLLILVLLAGLVIGGFIGDYFGTISPLSFLSYGKEFGLTSPLVLDLGILKLQFALAIRFTLAGILGMAIGGFLYRKL